MSHGTPALRLPSPPRFGGRARLLLGIALAAALAWFVLGLSPTGLAPHGGGLRILGMFLEGALSPALTYEAQVPAGTPALLSKVAAATRTTIVFAAAGMSLALVIGIVLGLLGSASWWAEDGRIDPRSPSALLFGAVRLLIAAMRSVHELLWAVLFLAAFGLTSFSAVLAIAIPYGGTLAKVFSEMVDESPHDSARSLRAIGAPRLAVFLFGLVPRALADTSAYSFYRFECAVRSSAVLGFFGHPTIGYYLRLSAENMHYREVWTYLYALLGAILLLELWSSLLRRRIALR